MVTNRVPLLQGRGASAGIVVGPVKQVRLGLAVTEFPEDAILVAKMTDPSMLGYMLRAAGIVTNTGGVTSHAAIVSRELGIPCVVATERATEVLLEGMTVEIDGTSGAVYAYR